MTQNLHSCPRVYLLHKRHHECNLQSLKDAGLLQHAFRSFEFAVNSFKIKHILYNAGFNQFHPMHMKLFYQSIYYQTKVWLVLPYISWQVRSTDSTKFPCAFMMRFRCSSPAERVSSIVRVTWIPTSAKGYHGSEIWRDWDDPDSATIRRASTGYVVQNEWSCFSPRTPTDYYRLHRMRYLSPESLSREIYLENPTTRSDWQERREYLDPVYSLFSIVFLVHQSQFTLRVRNRTLIRYDDGKPDLN